jgi:hypothetical protein
MISGVNAQTLSSYTIQASDVTKLVTFNNVGPVAVTLPSPSTQGFGTCTMFSLKNIGSGTVTVTPSSGLINGQSSLSLPSGQGADIWNDGTNYIAQGSMSGTVVPGTFPRWDQLLDPTVSHTSDFNNTSFLFNNGSWNFGTMSLQLPSAAGFKAGVTAQIGYDPVTNNLHFFSNTDSIAGLFPANTTFVNGDLAGISFSGGQLQLIDVPANGSNPGTNNSFLQVTVNNPGVGQTFCIDSVTGSQFVTVNCSPGIPINVQTSNYTVDPINDRGTAIISNDAAPSTVTYSTAFSPATNFDANWFDFQANKNAGTVTVSLTAPTVFDSTGNQTETILEGQECSFLSDDSAGVVYPKCHEPRITAGSGVSLVRSPYGLQISATGSGGTITGTGTNNTVTKWTAASVVGNSSVTDDGTNPTREPKGNNTGTQGNYEEYTVDTGGVTVGLALCVTSNVDGAGRPKVLACSHTATQPGAGFVGIAQATVAATGTVEVCWTVNCSATFDNASTALHEAILSVTTDGRLHDTGSQSATGGQPNFAVLNANGGVGTNSLISLTGMLAQNPNGGGGNGNTVKPIASGTNALGTSAIASGACGTATTSVATNALTTDNVIADFNADPTSTTGYQAGAMLTIVKWVSANQVNFKQCNNTANSITPAAVTLNWRIVR